MLELLKSQDKLITDDAFLTYSKKKRLFLVYILYTCKHKYMQVHALCWWWKMGCKMQTLWEHHGARGHADTRITRAL